MLNGKSQRTAASLDPEASCVTPKMFDTPSRKVLFWLFIAIYLPFLYQYGYKFISRSNIDFPTYYWAAKLTFEQHRSPFTADAFTEAGALFGEKIYPYLYPPPSLLVFYPLTLFSYETAKLVMLVVNHLCIILFIYLLFTKILTIDFQQPLRKLIAALLTIYVLAHYPLVSNINNGQINLVVLVFLCLTWYALKRNSRALLIALPLSLAVLIKVYPLLLMPLLIIKKKYGAIGWLMGLLLAYSVIAYVVLPHSVWSDWSAYVLPTGGYAQTPVGFALFSPAKSSNQNINGFVARIFLSHEHGEALWFNPTVGRAVAYLLAACVTGITVGLSYLCSRRADGEGLIDQEFSLYLLMMFLVAPLSWEHHLAYVLPAAIVALYLVVATRKNYLFYLLVIIFYYFVAWKLPYTDPSANAALRKGPLTLAVSLKFYAIVAIWVFIAIEMRRFLRGSAVNQEHKPHAYGTYA